MPQGGRPTVGAQGGRNGSAAASTLAALLTAGTGITLSAAPDPRTISVNLSTGVAGGQSVIGDTAAGGNLTLTSTSNVTKGKIVFGTTALGYFDEANAAFRAANGTTATPSYAFINSTGTGFSWDAVNSRLQISVAGTQWGEMDANHLYMTSTFPQIGFSPAVDSTITRNGTGGLTINTTAGAGTINLQTASTDRHVITQAGGNQVVNAPFASWSSGAAITPAGATVVEWSITPPNVASSAGATLDAHKWDAKTVTITGATNITTATGFNFIDHEQPTLSAGSALSVSAAANVTIKGGPIGGGAGPATLTASYGLWVQAPSIANVSLGGSLAARFDDQIRVTATNDPANIMFSMRGAGTQRIDGDGSVQVNGGAGVTIYGNGSEGLHVDANANCILANETVMANAATNGFVYLRTVAGTPTGAPTAVVGHVAAVFDTTAHKLWINDGTWKSVTFA